MNVKSISAASRSRNAKRGRVSNVLVPEPSGTVIESKSVAILVGITPHQVGQYIRDLAEEKGIEASGKGKWRWK